MILHEENKCICRRRINLSVICPDLLDTIHEKYKNDTFICSFYYFLTWVTGSLQKTLVFGAKKSLSMTHGCNVTLI